MGRRSTWTSKDDESAAGSCCIWRELGSDGCATKSHSSWCSQTGYGLGRQVGRFEERARAEGEGEIAMRLHERIHAMRHHRRRLPLRDRLRRRRRLMALALKKGNRTLWLPEN